MILISHSLGSAWTNFLLQNLDQSFKDKYIDKWISIAPALFGSPKTLLSLLYGENEDIPYVGSKALKPMFQTWQTVFWLMPHKKLYGD